MSPEESVQMSETVQKVNDLKFALYHRPLHPELFRIYQSRHIERGAYQADIWITGLSHVLTVQSAGRCVAEVTAEDLEALPQNGLVTSFQFRGERDHQEEFDDGMRYILSTQVERMNQNLFHASHRDLLNYGANRGLLVTFNDWVTGGSDLVPFSFIDFEARDREFHVQVFHSYPADFTIVKTQSIVEIGPAKAASPKPTRSQRAR